MGYRHGTEVDEGTLEAGETMSELTDMIPFVLLGAMCSLIGYGFGYERGLEHGRSEHRGMREIRANHPWSFRSGEWAKIVDCRIMNNRACFHVRFQDGAEDDWVCFNAASPYEFR